MLPEIQFKLNSIEIKEEEASKISKGNSIIDYYVKKVELEI